MSSKDFSDACNLFFRSLARSFLLRLLYTILLQAQDEPEEAAIELDITNPADNDDDIEEAMHEADESGRIVFLYFNTI